MLCELQEGTLLGALKFGGSLPWEVDADVTLHAKNFTSFATLIFPYFRKLGFKCVSDFEQGVRIELIEYSNSLF